MNDISGGVLLVLGIAAVAMVVVFIIMSERSKRVHGHHVQGKTVEYVRHLCRGKSDAWLNDFLKMNPDLADYIPEVKRGH